MLFLSAKKLFFLLLFPLHFYPFPPPESDLFTSSLFSNTELEVFFSPLGLPPLIRS